MPILMGPVLSFRGCENGKWNVTALVVTDGGDPGDLTTDNASVKADVLWNIKRKRDNIELSYTAHRYTFSFPMDDDTEKKASYAVMGETYEVLVPAKDQAPTMAYASCNGFSSLKLMKTVKDNNSLWKRMARKHGLTVPSGTDEDEPSPKDPTTPYHLLLMGGDQVYADAMWEQVPFMEEWNAKTWNAGNRAPVPDGMSDALDWFYFNLYTDRWSQPEVRRMLARVPTIMMWDDHDLIDGWGSYPEERQTSPVYGAIWTSASKAFAVFQQQLKDDELRRPGGLADRPGPQFPVVDGAFSFGYVVGGIAILAMDMRSQRTAETQVIGAAHWNDIFNWIEKDLAGKDIDHLMVLASIPVVYPGFDSLETLLGFLPGHQDLEDDLRDHWDSKPHKQERLRFIQRLLKVAGEEGGMRPTLLSGDVHVAALGVIERDKADSDTAVNQLISSGIVHPGPGAVVLFALRHLFDSDEEIERGVIARMTKFPGNIAKFVGGRNYLSLEPDRASDNRRIWCNWLVEHDPHPYTKVITAKGRPRVAAIPQGPSPMPSPQA